VADVYLKRTVIPTEARTERSGGTPMFATRAGEAPIATVPIRGGGNFASTDECASLATLISGVLIHYRQQGLSSQIAAQVF
jgi:hypothetical protein